MTLTPKAFELLLALARRIGKVVSRHELLRDVWGYSAEVTTRTVDAHVAELRRKLEDDAANPRRILTVWKVGYRLMLRGTKWFSRQVGREICGAPVVS